jgi:hypothetical protein
LEDGMTDIRARWMAACCLLSLALWPVAACTEGDHLLATVNKPATITATQRAPLGDAESVSPRRVIISVTNYHPTDDGSPVEVVVKGHVDNDAGQEVGRFGITPDREFVADPAGAQRFGFTLPQNLATARSIAFSVHLVPVRGDGKGASLRVGDLEVR